MCAADTRRTPNRRNWCGPRSHEKRWNPQYAPPGGNPRAWTCLYPIAVVARTPAHFPFRHGSAAAFATIVSKVHESAYISEANNSTFFCDHYEGEPVRRRIVFDPPLPRAPLQYALHFKPCQTALINLTQAYGIRYGPSRVKRFLPGFSSLLVVLATEYRGEPTATARECNANTNCLGG